MKCKYYIIILIILLTVDFLTFNINGALHGIPPAGDSRAHIFRIYYFYKGITSFNYVPIQYHGYAFLAGYGILIYAIGYLFSLLLIHFVNNFMYAGILSYNLLWLLTPIILAFSSILFLETFTDRFSLLLKIIMGSIIIILPTVIFTIGEMGAVPFVWSFSFSLLAIRYGININKWKQSDEIKFLLFSTLSIYTETFGYILMAINYPLLFYLNYKRALRLLAWNILFSIFSLVQLVEVIRYMAPMLDVPSFFLRWNFSSFLDIYYLYLKIFMVAIVIFTIYYIASRNKFILYIIYMSTINFMIATLAVGRVYWGWNFFLLNHEIEGILPWRFLYIDLCVYIIIGFFFIISKLKWNSIRYFLPTILFILILLFEINNSIIPIKSFAPIPNPNQLKIFTGKNIMVPFPDLGDVNDPVVFSPLFNYSTTNGPFSQGDPSFYYITVYYEWMDAFILNYPSFVNLMHLTGSNEIIAPYVSNTYGFHSMLVGYYMNYPVYYLPTHMADAITPILVVGNESEILLFSLFVNILGENGYILSFVTNSHIPDVKGTIVLPGYNSENVSQFPKPIILVINSNITKLLKVNNSVYILYTNALKCAKNIFPYKPYLPTIYFGNFTEHIPLSCISNATYIATELIDIIKPVYYPVNVEINSDSYTIISNTTLPILLKVSYYPYFITFPRNGNYGYNVYHFIILWNSRKLIWHLPYYLESAEFTVFSFILYILYYILIYKRAFSAKIKK